MMKLAGSNCETVMRWATWKMQCSYVEDPFRSSQGVLNHETSTIWRIQHNTRVATQKGKVKKTLRKMNTKRNHQFDRTTMNNYCVFPVFFST